MMSNMKKLIVFIWAAVLVSCSPQETLEVKHKEYLKKESKKKDSSYKDNKGSKGLFYYERSLDTIKGSDEYVIVAVYRSYKGISTEVLCGLPRLD